MELKYREGNMADKGQLRELAIVSYGQFEKALTEENWAILEGKLNAQQSYSDMLGIAKCFVCEHEDKIIGVGYIVPSGNPTDIFEADWCYIRMVGVNPKFRGNGIGKELTQLCVDYARETGEQIIALHTSEFMDSARELYERMGFIRVKEIEPIFGKRYWLYQLRLDKK
jgi:ribosomal protein S18 acetylase RimI-like enzyme